MCLFIPIRSSPGAIHDVILHVCWTVPCFTESDSPPRFEFRISWKIILVPVIFGLFSPFRKFRFLSLSVLLVSSEFANSCSETRFVKSVNLRIVFGSVRFIDLAGGLGLC